MGEKNCCCCFSVKTGAYVIGVLSILGLLDELNNFNLLRCIIKLVVSASFLAMVFQDSKTTRMWFFIIFLGSPFAQILAAIIDKPQEQADQENAINALDFRKIAEEACRNMSQQELQDMHYSNQQECIDGMEIIIKRAVFVVIVVLVVFFLIVPIHFACVLYNHWKNSERSVEEGGVSDFK